MTGMRLLAAMAAIAACCWCQQPEFEVASVKPNRSGSTNSNFNRTAGGGLNASNVTVRMLVLFAYDLREQQLTGGPSWMDSDRYDIVAKPDRDDNPGGAKRSFQ